MLKLVFTPGFLIVKTLKRALTILALAFTFAEPVYADMFETNFPLEKHPSPVPDTKESAFVAGYCKMIQRLNFLLLNVETKKVVYEIVKHEAEKRGLSYDEFSKRCERYRQIYKIRTFTENQDFYPNPKIRKFREEKTGMITTGYLCEVKNNASMKAEGLEISQYPVQKKYIEFNLETEMLKHEYYGNQKLQIRWENYQLLTAVDGPTTFQIRGYWPKGEEHIITFMYNNGMFVSAGTCIKTGKKRRLQ